MRLKLTTRNGLYYLPKGFGPSEGFSLGQAIEYAIHLSLHIHDLRLSAYTNSGVILQA